MEGKTWTTYRPYYDRKVKRKSKGKRGKRKEEKENVCADLSSCRQSKPAERLSTTLICFRLFPYLDFSRQVTRVPRTSFKSGTLIYVPSHSSPLSASSSLRMTKYIIHYASYMYTLIEEPKKKDEDLLLFPHRNMFLVRYPFLVCFFILIIKKRRLC